MALAHSRWLIGDGRSIDVTEDSWVDALPLRLWPTMFSGSGAEGLRISDLLRPGAAEWDGDRLDQLFGEHLAERVRALPISGSAGPDVRVWSTTCRASVGVGDVSRVIQRESVPGLDCGWEWRVGLYQRAALFLWKVAWECLPMCSVLSRRGVSLPPLCPDCGVNESVDHVLFQCDRARDAWRLTRIPEDAWSRRDCFLKMVQRWAGIPQMRGMAIRASCTAYQIWLARNASVFGEGSPSPWFVMERARAQAAEIIHVDLVHRPLTARNIWGPHTASAAPHRVIEDLSPGLKKFGKQFEPIYDGYDLGKKRNNDLWTLR
ncbi:uncharacterized protein LOC120107614 [Phoenix dactylifera]|uniref:Uncharacterized protein LOC120107614 n=1 Tax=Phoenix dactylifera TaxID=42345 RepID=A0A8B9A088_PHODC|nr:uncharacterized protein LOC120107614 [Phoenix dactylifera]